jgi:signal transduction histidine kinase
MADKIGVPLTVELAGNLPLLHTDGQRVQQILVNLLSNAVKFTGKEGVRLEAALCGPSSEVSASTADCWLDVRVSDTGPGLSPENQTLIFEEFEQVSGTTGGTGLGLPISRRFARLLGGDLLVESDLGAVRPSSSDSLRAPLARPLHRRRKP